MRRLGVSLGSECRNSPQPHEFAGPKHGAGAFTLGRFSNVSVNDSGGVGQLAAQEGGRQLGGERAHLRVGPQGGDYAALFQEH